MISAHCCNEGLSVVKRAFTLVELMAVVGLMGLLATLSVVAWGSISKGMSDRAAHEALEGFVRSSLRVARMEESPVVLRFRTYVIPADDDFEEEKICRAVAVRAAGRVSRLLDGHPWDEFAEEGPVRLDETQDLIAMTGDGAEWKVGDPYGRVFATLELPRHYFVEDGVMTTSGSVTLLSVRQDGTVETVGEPISVGDSE